MRNFGGRPADDLLVTSPDHLEQPRAIRVGLLAVDLGVYALILGSLTRAHAGFLSFWDSYAAYAVIILTTVIALARPILRRQDRGTWLGMGLFVACWTIGNITFSWQSRNGTLVPTPSWDDIGYLLVYPAAYIGLALQHRSTGQARSLRDRGSWVDGLAAAMAICGSWTPSVPLLPQSFSCR